MAKKKPPEPPPGPTPKANSLVIRGSPEWREWLKRAADHDRSQSVADFIDRAVAAYARQIAFKEVPPKR